MTSSEMRQIKERKMIPYYWDLPGSISKKYKENGIAPRITEKVITSVLSRLKEYDGRRQPEVHEEVDYTRYVFSISS